MRTDLRQQIYAGLGEAGFAGLDFTRKAFGMLPKLDRPHILDIGCGQGRATLELARLSGGQVVGLDIDRTALAVLSRRIEEQWYGSAFLVMQKCGAQRTRDGRGGEAA